VVKLEFVKSTTHLACRKQKPYLPSMQMELVMLRSKETVLKCGLGVTVMVVFHQSPETAVSQKW
jgi:hypothetical protein